MSHCKKGRAAPPPLTQDEWPNIAADHIKDKFILHVDGTAAYNVKPDGVEITKTLLTMDVAMAGRIVSKKQLTSAKE